MTGIVAVVESRGSVKKVLKRMPGSSCRSRESKRTGGEGSYGCLVAAGSRQRVKESQREEGRGCRSFEAVAKCRSRAGSCGRVSRSVSGQ